MRAKASVLMLRVGICSIARSRRNNIPLQAKGNIDQDFVLDVEFRLSLVHQTTLKLKTTQDNCNAYV